MNDLENIARQLEASGDYKILRRMSVGSHLAPYDGSEQRLAIYVDLETTGLNPDTDEIIEIGMVPFYYNPDGRIFSISGHPFSALREPSESIPEDITKITGITQDMVRGKHIDPADVERFAENADLIIAHNAGFDRKFLERFAPQFARKPWACSMSQIPWKEEGFDGSRLSHLANGYGFFYDAHRATTDCHAGIEVLSRELPVSHELAMARLLTTARAPTHRVWAVNAPFDLKDILKARGYRWNDGNDGRPKAWHSDIDQDGYKAELEFLENEIYGCSINLPVTEITAFERFSNRV
ncbi:MAG: 3'-5' exonuclease [Oleispira sp.]|nr:3'-5' exonuclease [Oleispira sp.]